MTDRISTTRTYTEQQLLDDYSTSFWLKRQIEETKRRDILDARTDAEMLLMVLEQRCIDSGLIEKQ